MADIHQMNPAIYKAAVDGKHEDYYEALGKTATDNEVGSRQVTPCGNTVLHVAALHGRKQFVENILKREKETRVIPSILFDQNNRKETALHCAAERGYAEVVSVILGAAKKYEDVEHGVEVSAMIGMTDNAKDTALHKAVRMGHFEVVRILVEEDTKFVYEANDAGETPIYIAAEKPFQDCLEEMLNKCEKPTFDGPLGRNALHAIILSDISDSGPTSMWRILLFPFLVANPLKTTEPAKLLLEKEISLCESKDEYGWTPLHYAVELRDYETVKMIMEKKSSAAYIRAGKEGHKKEGGGDEEWTTILHIAARDDNVKMMKCIPDKIPDCWDTMMNNNSKKEGGDEEWTTIFHIAARDDNVKMMKFISDRIPDCWDMLNSKSQNVFHEAAAGGKKKRLGPRSAVVKYIVKSPHFNRLLDQKDKDGNSPLHMLAISDCRILQTKPFSKHKHLFFNHNNQTPLDVALEHKERFFFHGVFQQGGKHVWSDSRIGRRGNFVEDPKKNKNTPAEEKHIETMLKSSDTNTIVATLILGLAFAAGFTVPGGYDGNPPVKKHGKTQGFPILLRNTAFMGFVIADTIAFVCSFLSILFHIWLLLTASSASRKYRNIVKIYTMEAVLLACAFIAVVATFLSGTHATLAPFRSLAISILALTFTIFIITFLLSIYETIVNFYLRVSSM